MKYFSFPAGLPRQVAGAARQASQRAGQTGRLFRQLVQRALDAVQEVLQTEIKNGHARLVIDFLTDKALPAARVLLLERMTASLLLRLGLRGAFMSNVAGWVLPFVLEKLFQVARTDPQAQLHSKEELVAALPETDVVINCLPGSADGFFSADLVAAMRPGSIYASVGRGNTTDEPALISALQAGRLGGAVLDVTATEPIPAGHPLWALPNVLLTQHTGGGQPREAEGKIDQLLRNLERLRTGQPLENAVQLAQGY